MHTDISIVVPLFNEEESLPELVDWIEKVCSEHGYAHEVIMVDDGSTDDSWKVVQEPCIDYVVKYHPCGTPYRVKVVTYKTVRIPVERLVKVCY